MKRVLLGLILVLVGAVVTEAQVFRTPADADYTFTLSLVDATDGYAAETEKKAADTTITYCRVTDSNSTASFDDTGHWFEIGDGTGDYKLVMGATEFTEPNEVYFVKVVVAGCRSVRFRVETEVSIASHFKDVATTTDMATAAGTGTAASFTAMDTDLANIYTWVRKIYTALWKP